MDLLQSRIGDARHKDLLGYCTRIGENVGGLARELRDECDFSEFRVEATLSHFGGFE